MRTSPHIPTHSYRRRGRGEEGFEMWESSAGLDSWERAPAPAQVGKRLIEGLFARELPPQRARLVNNITHWAYGATARRLLAGTTGAAS